MEKEGLDFLQLEPPVSLKLRSKFVDAFIDGESPRYQKYIEPFRNAENTTQAYWGYLWDNIDKSSCFVDYCDPVKIEKEMQRRNLFDSPLYLTWDVHLPRYDAALTKLNRIFQTQGIIKITFSFYLKYDRLFPEDVYFFDESVKWCAILTHEEAEQRRWCLWVDRQR